jgi:hypothetical protein
MRLSVLSPEIISFTVFVIELQNLAFANLKPAGNFRADMPELVRLSAHFQTSSDLRIIRKHMETYRSFVFY